MHSSKHTLTHRHSYGLVINSSEIRSSFGFWPNEDHVSFYGFFVVFVQMFVFILVVLVIGHVIDFVFDIVLLFVTSLRD